MMLTLMMILRWDNVNVGDNVNMRWCWWWYWDETMLILIMTLEWDDVDVDDVIVMMYVVYTHEGCAVTIMDIPRGGNRVVREF